MSPRGCGLWVYIVGSLLHPHCITYLLGDLPLSLSLSLSLLLFHGGGSCIYSTCVTVGVLGLCSSWALGGFKGGVPSLRSPNLYVAIVFACGLGGGLLGVAHATGEVVRVGTYILKAWGY